MRRSWMKLGVVICALSWMACSGDEEPQLAGEGEACSVGADCEQGLLCRSEVCVPDSSQPDAGNNNNNGDAANNLNNTNNTNNTNNINNVQSESFYISYNREDLLTDEIELRLLNTQTGEDIKINPDDVSCGRGCWMTEDLGHFVYAEQNAGLEDVKARPVNDGFTLGDEMIVASGVSQIRIQGNHVSYSKVEGMNRVAFFREIPSGTETQIGIIGSTNNNLGSWFIDPASNTAVLYNATLVSLEIRVGEMGAVVESDPVYTVDASNFRNVGSFFSSNIPSAVSRDGSTLGLLLNAPMDYEACMSDSDCTGPGQICGNNDRCTVQQHVVLMIELGSDTLGEPCSGDAACGEIHTCDIPAETQLDQASCIPRRVALGLPGGVQQGATPRTGCALTMGNLESYTSIRPPLSFGSAGNLYLVGSRDCVEDNLNMPKTDILSLSPRSNEPTIVFGNPGADFDDSLCFDEEEETISIENCEVFIKEALTSPNGDTVAFTATNPNVVDPSLADSTYDLWTVLRNGEDKDWIGKNSDFYSVTSLRTHALE